MVRVRFAGKVDAVYENGEWSCDDPTVLKILQLETMRAERRLSIMYLPSPNVDTVEFLLKEHGVPLEIVETADEDYEYDPDKVY